jgi:L-malate glycosyltransferase
MLGSNPGWVVTQGEILARLFAAEGYTIRISSAVPYRLLRLVDIIQSLIRWRHKVDLVVLAVFSGPAFLPVDIASLLAKWLQKPLIMVLRGGGLPEFTQSHPGWVHRVLTRGDIIVSPSKFLAQYYEKSGFCIKIIPNVLDIDRYHFRHKQSVQPRIVWMRTFHPDYSPDMAIEVLKKLQPELPQVCLTMAGQDKGLLASLKQYVEQEGLADRVRFAGFLNMEGKQREFAIHDIYLNTNRVDNMPVSVLEAAAFGLPIVATNVGGIPYLLDNENTALLVADADVQGMADAVLRLVREPQLAAHLSKNGRQLAESCSWPAVKLQWETLFETLCI